MGEVEIHHIVGGIHLLRYTQLVSVAALYAGILGSAVALQSAY